ncbi:MAG: NAD(P)/FAD-dependent oxidoreductase [Gemmataceae bacterium]|nr:NAD(P)/FAD-dependent oxidoreductase [Gemmataceae bacterium]
MAQLLVVGAGLFGSQAAALARARGIDATVFDPGLPGAASPAAAGLFQEAWAGRRWREHFVRALPVLDQLYGLRRVHLTHADGTPEELLFVPPAAILDSAPVRQSVTAVGDGWLEAGGRRHEGWVYVAAGVWSNQFVPDVNVYGKAGSAFVFAGERPGAIRPIAHGRQAIAFVRDPGTTHFSDGAAERHHTADHDRQSLERAAALGLTDPPLARLWGRRPYTPGGPVFRRIGARTWLATGGRKMGTILGASFARRLIEDELTSPST